MGNEETERNGKERISLVYIKQTKANQKQKTQNTAFRFRIRCLSEGFFYVKWY